MGCRLGTWGKRRPEVSRSREEMQVELEFGKSRLTWEFRLCLPQIFQSSAAVMNTMLKP